jgi:transposase
MSRKCKTADDEATRNATVTLRACLPPDHWARFIVDVITPLDLRAIYAPYSPRGGEAIAPEMLCGLLLYGDATGTCSARKIARATAASMPFHFRAGGLHPAHDTLATCRTTFRQALTDLFVPIRLYDQEIGGLTLGTISLDGTTIPADASQRRASSDKRLLALDSQRHTEVDKVCALTEQAEQTAMPQGLVIAAAIAFRPERLAHLAQAQAV